MDIGFGGVGDIEIHHMAEAGNIDAARRHIGGNQGLQLAFTKIAQHFLPQALAHITMQRVNGEITHLHEFGQRIGAALGPHKDQALARIFLIQHIT